MPFAPVFAHGIVGRVRPGHHRRLRRGDLLGAVEGMPRLANASRAKLGGALGGAGRAIDYSVVSATAIWYVQVGALVAGHVAALVLAHDRALVLYGNPRDATRSQAVMLTLMVCFTCLGLWLLSAANS